MRQRFFAANCGSGLDDGRRVKVAQFFTGLPERRDAARLNTDSHRLNRFKSERTTTDFTDKNGLNSFSFQNRFVLDPRASVLIRGRLLSLIGSIGVNRC
jgi:hypothetical protein